MRKQQERQKVTLGNKIINEALRTVESAVGKQIPRKPDIWGDGVDDDGDLIYDSWACPCCHEEYELGYDDYEYCPNCGQAIDWRENNG